MALRPDNPVGGAERAAWQAIPDNQHGVTVTYPPTNDGAALPVITIDLRQVPGGTDTVRQGERPLQMRTAGTGDRFTITVTTDKGTTHEAHRHGIDLVVDAICNELARKDLREVQIDQLHSLLAQVNDARSFANFRDDPKQLGDGRALNRYQDAVDDPANAGKSIPRLAFFDI